MGDSNSLDESDDQSQGVLDRVRKTSNTEPETTATSKRWFGRSSERAQSESTEASGGLLGRMRRSDRESDESTDPSDTEVTSRSWFDRKRNQYGLGALLVGIGIVLFVFPEPVTSTAGIALIVAGVIIWLLNVLR